jgi:uncharacterized membrane protein YoaK (UPF0700 family)
MQPLHSQDSVFSARHTPSWVLLATAGGAVNAIAFVSCSRFVSHVTGTVSRIGIDASDRAQPIALESGLVLFALILGATAASMLAHFPTKTGRASQSLSLFIVAAMLAALAALGTTGLFGAVDGLVDGPRSVMFLALLAFAMGLQNAAVAMGTGMTVRTTHMTGPATDMGVHLANALHATGSARALALRHVALRACTITGFTFGACAGAWLAGQVAFRALYMPSGAIVIATLSSFIRTGESGNAT